MTGAEKFQECKNRSEGNVVKSVRICCNRFTETTGYECVKRQIFPLTANHCEECGEFEQK